MPPCTPGDLSSSIPAPPPKSPPLRRALSVPRPPLAHPSPDVCSPLPARPQPSLQREPPSAERLTLSSNQGKFMQRFTDTSTSSDPRHPIPNSHSSPFAPRSSLLAPDPRCWPRSSLLVPDPRSSPSGPCSLPSVLASPSPPSHSTISLSVVCSPRNTFSTAKVAFLRYLETARPPLPAKGIWQSCILFISTPLSDSCILRNATFVSRKQRSPTTRPAICHSFPRSHLFNNYYSIYI